MTVHYCCRLFVICFIYFFFFFFFFFFQAEDGIRDLTVTGVQTCALPISARSSPSPRVTRSRSSRRTRTSRPRCAKGSGRSEERRVGKECRSRGAPYH